MSNLLRIRNVQGRLLTSWRACLALRRELNRLAGKPIRGVAAQVLQTALRNYRRLLIRDLRDLGADPAEVLARGKVRVVEPSKGPPKRAPNVSEW
jgi:hypothetical protein